MTRHALNRRTFLKATAALPALTATTGFLTVSAGAADMVKVDMQLGWLASNGVLGEVVALRKGFFKEEGLNVNIIPAKGTAQGIQNVESGLAQIGFIDVASLVVARAEGSTVKVVSVIYQKAPFCFFSLDPGANVRSIKDFEGLKVDFVGNDERLQTQPKAEAPLDALLAYEVSAREAEAGSLILVKKGADNQAGGFQILLRSVPDLKDVTVFGRVVEPGLAILRTLKKDDPIKSVKVVSKRAHPYEPKRKS